jgi:CRISPR system Cascade subunit CasC
MKSENHIVQFHILRSLPANLANSGSDGAPKQMPYGGSQRTRLSSQSIKSRIRASSYFRDGSIPMATRTAALPELVRLELKAMGADDDAMIEAIVGRITELGKESGNGKEKKAEEPADGGEAGEEAEAGKKGKEKDAPAFVNTKAAFLLAPHEPREIAEHFVRMYTALGPAKFAKEDIGKLTSSFRSGGPLAGDTALFGRFSTSATLPVLEAAASFAHAFTSSASRPQIDWFNAREETEYGNREVTMIGEGQFATGCYYLYVNLDLDTLLDNLHGDPDMARSVAEAFVRSLCSPQAVPAGKEHGMSVVVAPDLVVAEVVPYPLSYAPAFEKHVRPTDGLSLAEASAAALREYFARLETVYDDYQVERRVLSMLPGEQLDETVKSLADWVAGFVPEE